MNNQDQYWLYRLKLEKLKQKTWSLVILARLLLFLALIAAIYLRM